MTSVASTRAARPGPGARRAGYAVAAGVDVLLLVLVNGWPGWDAVPVLTPDTELVLGPVNASLAVGLLVNLAYLVHDPPRLRAAGDVVTSAVGLVALVVLWRVFPLDVGDGWRLVARVLLGLGVVGSVVAIVTGLVRLLR
jgi:hypothetical protein